jgi:lipoprotein-anchoring transpeptidase ErfK/SrfK
MRTRSWVLVGLGVVVVAVAVDLPLAYISSSRLAPQRANTARLLAEDASRGLAPARSTSLHQRLGAVDTTKWWSPDFLFSGQQRALAAVRQATELAWHSAVTADRLAATKGLISYSSFVGQNTAWVTASAAGQERTLNSKLTSAATPAALEALVVDVHSSLDAVQSQVKAAEAKAAAGVAVANGSGGILAQASQLEVTAKADELSALAVPQDAAALQQALSSNQPSSADDLALSQQITALRAEIGLNQKLVQQSFAVMSLVDQAGAEQTSDAAALLAQYQTASAAFTAAQTATQLAVIQSTFTSLQQATVQSLSQDQCGHTTIPGKSIHISLSLQEMVFYDNGCEVQATPITTGRPQLRTPTGTFHIFEKETPYVFVSPWPPSSPFWYPTSPVTWVMEFDQGGYYIHDAPWEAPLDFGPNSENLLYSASHGCVHTPHAVMEWAYGWTPIGTTVVITS